MVGVAANRRFIFLVPWSMSVVVVGLVVIAAVAGLTVDGVYVDSENAKEALRGNDMVNLVVGIPIMVIALWMTARGSTRGHLLWLAMITYVMYGYAYYVFGPTFNSLFLLHVAIFSLSMVALGFGLGAFDPTNLRPRWESSVLPRAVAIFLILIVATLIGNYAYETIRYSTGGELPTDVLPFEEWRVHLGYALDLSIIAPASIIAAVLLWKNSTWGYTVAAILLIFLAVFQLNFLGSALFMDAAGIAGVEQAIPQAIASTVVFAIPAVLLTWGVSRPPVTSTP